MNFLKKIALSVYSKPSLYLFIFLIIFSSDRQKRWFNSEQGDFPFVHDVAQYYSYLDAAFIKHDLTFSFPNVYWNTKMPNGNNIPKVTMGMAIMYSPFFLIGKITAGELENNPFSLPYKKAIHFGSIFYSLLGLWLLRKSLLRFFSEYITLVTLICVYFGTNLFYYTYGHGEMPHAYLFFLFSAFILCVLKWEETKKTRHLFLFSFIAGFATLIRPTECLILLFPLLVGVKSMTELKEKFKTVFSYKFKLWFACILFLFPFFAQMLYWKVYSGNWFFFSYGDERFFFNDPQLTNFLFSFRKGWFIYTPIMIFSVIGIFLFKDRAKNLRTFSVFYFLISIYLLSSWWDWAFGGSFGCRALVHSYAFFAFPFAAFVHFAFSSSENNAIRYAVGTAACAIFILFINLNIHQSWQYKYAIIPADGMTKEAYFYLLKKEKLTLNELDELSKKVTKPSREEMRKGKRD